MKAYQERGEINVRMLLIRYPPASIIGKLRLA